MKINTTKKVAAFISAIVLALSGSGTAISAFAETTENTSVIDFTYTRFDIQKLNDAGAGLKDACLKENNDAEVLEKYQKIFEMYRDYGSAFVLASLDKDIYGKFDEYVYENSISTEVTLAFSEALYFPFFESQYKKLFEDSVSPYIRSMVMSIHSEAQDISAIDNQTQTELTQKYQELCLSFNSGSVSIEDFEIKSAEIYIDLTKNKMEQLAIVAPEINFEDVFFSFYNRDYSKTDIEKNKESIINTTKYIYQYAADTLTKTCAKYRSEDILNALYTNERQCDFITDVLLEYGSDISGDVYDSAKFMQDNGLLFLGTQSGIYGGYTTFLLNQNVPLVFVNGQSDRDTLRMIIHEFGHFNSFLKSDLTEHMPNSDGPNIDISEVQSQGMELLFWNYYDDIYGDYSDLIKAHALFQIAETFLFGFSTNDFESEVISQIETITPEETVNLFHEKQNEYGMTEIYQTPFGAVSNYILSPFYSISYSMSLLPLWGLIGSTPEERNSAIEKYNKFTYVDAMDSTNTFLSSLSEAGYENILNDKYISSIRSTCADYADSIEGILNGDLTNDGTIAADDLIMLKKIILQDIETGSYNFKQADLNRDGKLTASDLAEMVYRIS